MKFVIAPHIRIARDDEGLVLLDTETGRYSTFNAVGSLVWNGIEQAESQQAIVHALQERFDDAPPDLIEADVASLIAGMVKDGLIRPGEPAKHRAATKNAPTSAVDGQARSGTKAGFLAALDALSSLIAIDVSMKLRGFRWLYEALGPCREAAGGADTTALADVCEAVDRAARCYFKRAWCLQRSATCVRLLRRRGLPAQLVIGVCTFPFEAHAWVELDGKVVNDTAEHVHRYLVIDRA